MEKLLFRLIVLVAAIAATGLWVSAVHTDRPGRLACPLTGKAECRDPDCLVRLAEEAFRGRLYEAIDPDLRAARRSCGPRSRGGDSRLRAEGPRGAFAQRNLR